MRFRHLSRIAQAAALCIALAFVPAELVAEPLPGGSLDPYRIPKYVDPLVIPPEMPDAGTLNEPGGKKVRYYEIEVVQFEQQILPSMTLGGPMAGRRGRVPLPKTTVWSYAAVGHPETRNYPAFTVEARVGEPIRVKWINNLVDAKGDFLPHLLPVDQTLHWANPPRECADGSSRTDCKGDDPTYYEGPVPIVTHVHGAHSTPESDGYPEAWWLPAAKNIPPGYATRGTLYDQYDRSNADPGTAVFQYANDQRSATLWYHDHSLGITRLNVYAGPAGFWLLRGNDENALKLPGPAPALGDRPDAKYFEIPIAIQDRSFNKDGSLFYPQDRAFFEGLKPNQLDIAFSPDSDVAPTWNPEAFFNTMVVNGRTWPRLNVEPRKYRLRLLNGCNSRFLILKLALDPLAPRPVEPVAATFQQIGSDGGLLPEAVEREELLMGPAERADVIVDFSAFPPGSEVYLINEGPDEPYGGGEPGEDFEYADPGSTGQVMMFSVGPLSKPDRSEVPRSLPDVKPLVSTNTRKLSLNEEESQEVCVRETPGGMIEQITSVEPGPDFAERCEEADGEVFGPTSALLGTLAADGSGVPLMWSDAITENPQLDSTETWEIYNFTADAHPIHLHLVQFQVVDRQPFDGPAYGPELGEDGYKDTVIAYPGEITRIRAHFDIEGLYVWHCHILEHEDNEMMRPYCVGDASRCPVPIASP